MSKDVRGVSCELPFPFIRDRRSMVSFTVQLSVVLKRKFSTSLDCSLLEPADNRFFFFFFFISLIAGGAHYYHTSCGHKESSHLSPVHALQFFLSRCKFSTLTTRQPMVEFYLLTFPRFPLRKKEHKSYFGKNRTHDFRTSRCAAYLLDHSGDERQ